MDQGSEAACVEETAGGLGVIVAGADVGDAPDPVERVPAAAPPAPECGAGYVVGSGRVSHRPGQQRGRESITVTASGEFLGGGGFVAAESVPSSRSRSGFETQWFGPVAGTSVPASTGPQRLPGASTSQVRCDRVRPAGQPPTSPVGRTCQGRVGQRATYGILGFGCDFNIFVLIQEPPVTPASRPMPDPTPTAIREEPSKVMPTTMKLRPSRQHEPCNIWDWQIRFWVSGLCSPASLTGPHTEGRPWQRSILKDRNRDDIQPGGVCTRRF